MRFYPVGLAALCLLASAGCGGGGNSSAPTGSTGRYTITDLGPYYVNVDRAAVNNAGQVAGTSGNVFIQNSAWHAYLYTNGTKQDLEPANENSSATGLNQAGQVVGATDSHAFLYTNGKAIDLGTLGGPTSAAVAINNRGQVVGTSDIKSLPSSNPFVPPVRHMFLYQNGKMTDIGTLEGYDTIHPNDINDAGQIVGQAGTLALNAPSTFPVAFLYTNGKATRLPNLGGTWSKAFAINNSGVIVGQSTTADDTHGPNFQFRAVVWQNGQITSLGTLPGGNHSLATGINNKGDIVGGSTTDPNNIYDHTQASDHGFLYRNGIMTDLNSVIPTNSGWKVLYEAISINDIGQILGVGRINNEYHLYLLTPRFNLP